MTNVNIEAGIKVLVEGSDDALEIVSIKGRWVKLSDGRNISRVEASEGADAWLLQEAELDAEETHELDLEDAEEGAEEGAHSKMTETLLKYRVGYEKATSYSGGATLDNGDDLAQALRGATPAQVCAVADKLCGAADGYHAGEYAHLNVGQQRMCAGNKIRALVKKGAVTADAVHDLLTQHA